MMNFCELPLKASIWVPAFAGMTVRAREQCFLGNPIDVIPAKAATQSGKLSGYAGDLRPGSRSRSPGMIAFLLTVPFRWRREILRR
jgi:hypothetical protein